MKTNHSWHQKWQHFKAKFHKKPMTDEERAAWKKEQEQKNEVAYFAMNKPFGIIHELFRPADTAQQPDVAERDSPKESPKP